MALENRDLVEDHDFWVPLLVRGEPPRTKDKRMNYEVIALGIVFAGIMSAVVVLAPWNADWRKLIVLATASGGLFFFAFVRLAAAADQVKGYCYADAHGYVIVTDGDIKDAKSFGEKAADDAAQYHNKTGNPLLATKLKALCEAEGAKRYPESRRVADWFAVQAAKAFMDEYARRTKK
jgi:hypothetical protein